MNPWALVLAVVIFAAGMGAGVRVHQGVVARAALEQEHQAAKERARAQDFAGTKALEHAGNVETLTANLVEAYEQITRLEARACLDPRSIRVLNGTGNLSRPAAPEPAPAPAAAGPAGRDPAGGLQWASNIDVGRYIAYCRTQYGKVADQLNKILDLEDQRHPLPNP